MAASLKYENVEVQFLYPFEISEWRRLKLLILENLDYLPFKKNPGLPQSIINLEKEISPESVELKELKKFSERIKSKQISNNKALHEYIDEALHKGDGYAHELFKIRLKKLKEKHEESSDERFFSFISSVIKESGVKVFFDDSERKGTRPYLQKSRPHIFITLPGTNLTIGNIDAIPNIHQNLNQIDGLPYLRFQSNIKLLASGFGLLKMRCCLFTKEGLEKAVDEIVFSSETKSCMGKSDHDKEILSHMIKKNIYNAIEDRDNPENPSQDKIDEHVARFCQKHCLSSIFIKQSIYNLIDRANVLKSGFCTTEIVDIQNLDRGSHWGNEPLFEWTENNVNYSPDKLYRYFDIMINESIINPLKNLNKKKLTKYFKNYKIPEELNDKLISALSHLERDSGWYAKEGVYPYVLTFVAAPSEFNKPNAKNLCEIEDYFSDQMKKTGNKLRMARLIMKSHWKISQENPIESSIQNLFFSDLLYMLVHIRSTLCFYYMPSNPAHEYKKYPRLYNSIKYKRELEDTLVSQRILWYMYTTFNHKVGQEIKSISKTFESLTAHIKKEEFHQILDELTEIIMGIDNRKIAITEIMEDPLSSKGSTLFMEMLNKTSKVFRLKQLYKTLNDQLDRLDMLGLHVNQSTNELSGMVIQETTRATQFTIEILEAFFIAVYFLEGIELAAGEWLGHLGIKPIIFFILGISIPFIALPLITTTRKSMSRFRGRVPVWQEWLEKIGFAVSLTMLSSLGYLILTKAHILQQNPFIFYPLLVVVPVGFYFSWCKIDSLFHKHGK